MKMAKADEKDIDAAGELMCILDAISRGKYPALEDEEDTPYHFDPDDFEHLQHFYNRVSATIDKSPGYPGRIIGGMCYVTLWEKNEILDPASNTLDLHPKFAKVASDRDELLAALKAIAEFDKYEPAGPAVLRAKDAIAKVEGNGG